MIAGAGAPAACTHCGLPLRARRRTASEAYCCSGCYLAQRLGRRVLEEKSDRLLARIVLSAFLAMGVMVFSLSLYGGILHGGDGSAASQALSGLYRLAALSFSLPVILLLGAPLADAVVALRRWLSAEALILAGTLSAWSLSVWNTFRGGGEVYFDTATMVLVLYSLGRWLDARSREEATAELRRLLPEREQPVARLDGLAGPETPVAPRALVPGDLVRLRPGEVVPVDGLVLSGRSFVDTSAMTGESQPRSFGPGERVHAGTTLVDGSLVLCAEATAGKRLKDEIEALLAAALAERPEAVRLADRLAGALLPGVLLLAGLTVFLRWSKGPEAAWLAALSVVLISCPCALGIATPLAFWSAAGAAWKRGVLVHGGAALEALARVQRLFLDKTGTLTSGELELAGVLPADGVAEREALALAAALELGSEHPIARSLRAAWSARQDRPLPEVEGFHALPGLGVAGRVDGEALALVRDGGEGELSWVALRRGEQVLARFALRARARPEARATVAALRARGLELAVLTGDGEGPARALERELGIPVRARLSPADKVACVRRAGAGTAFVGDGLNDAAALAAAGVGITVAGASSASLRAARVNLLRPGLAELPRVIDLARRAVLAARLNLAWAFLYNSIGLYLAVEGRLSPIFAASSMVVSSLFSALNARRLLARPAAPDRSQAGEVAGLELSEASVA
jgi:Cu2+-exporting ATPase